VKKDRNWQFKPFL